MTKSIQEQALEYSPLDFKQNAFIEGAKARDAELEQLKADLRTSDLNRQSLWADSLKLVDENAALKSKQKELHHYLISILPQLRTHGALSVRDEIIELLKSESLK